MFWPYLYDIILVLIFVLLIRRGWRTGFLASLLRLLGWVLALFLILKYSLSLADWTFSQILEQRIIMTVAAVIPEDLITAMNSGALATQDALAALQEVLNSLSGFLGQQTVNTAGVETVLALMQQSGMSLAQSITQTLLRPVIVPLLQALYSLVIFAVSLWLFKALARFSARHHTRRGLVGRSNSLLGAGIGLLESIAVVYLYVFILSALSDGLTLSFLNPSIYNKTLLVSLILK